MWWIEELDMHLCYLIGDGRKPNLYWLSMSSDYIVYSERRKRELPMHVLRWQPIHRMLASRLGGSSQSCKGSSPWQHIHGPSESLAPLITAAREALLSGFHDDHPVLSISLEDRLSGEIWSKIWIVHTDRIYREGGGAADVEGWRTSGPIPEDPGELTVQAMNYTGPETTEQLVQIVGLLHNVLHQERTAL